MDSFTSHAIVASAFIVSSLAGLSYAEDPEYAKMVQAHVTPAIEAESIPGAVVGIYKDGEVNFYPIGTLSYDSDKAPTIDTLFEIGSISKVITGTFFADAVRRGEVARNTIVNDLLPDGYQVKSNEGEELKLWHLTTHTSGWGTAPINILPEDGEKPFENYDNTKMFEAINLMPPKQAPGTKMEYSNFAVGVLGTLVAINAQTQRENEYESLVKERILEPLGIENFTIGLSDEQLAQLAPATTGGRTTTHWGKSGSMDPCGMWIANAPGLMKFAIANIEGGDDDVHDSIALAQESLYKFEGNQQICHGWFMYGDGTTLWHNGMTGGYSSYMAINPTHDVAVVMLTNGATFDTTKIGLNILQSVMGMDPEPIKIEVHEKLEESYTDRLVGVYESTMGFDFTISAARGRLFGQITGQQPLELVPVSENRFGVKLVDAELEFELPEEGNATVVTLFQNGMEIKSTRKE